MALLCSTELSLSNRVEYLSRAILCVKSGEAGEGGRAAGELLHHLEEKMEVTHFGIDPFPTPIRAHDG